MLTKLSNELTTNSSIGGFKVQSVSLSAIQTASSNSIVNDEANYYRMVAIIVGVVIPICLSNFFLTF